jgi:uncharacterized membrane protein (DUF4010 family)
LPSRAVCLIVLFVDKSFSALSGDLGGIALALALGLLVGVQRGWAQRQEKPGSRFAGIRTYGLIGLAGGVARLLEQSAPVLSAIMLSGSAALILMGYVRASKAKDSLSGTASVVSLLTLACGYLAAGDMPIIATAIAVAMVLLLALRSQLHRLVGKLSEEEVLAIGRFALIAVVILPLLPDQAYGPMAAWNPRQLWLVVVLVSGFSLAGYVATRLMGPSRGLLAAAAAGSMVSSTAVTAGIAARLKDPEQDHALASCGIALASAVMFVRVMVLVGLLAPFALADFAKMAVPGFIVSLAFAGWWLRKTRPSHQSAGDGLAKLRNPFAIGPALLLMAMVMAMTLAARWTLAQAGDAGLAIVLALSGSVDVDSAIITMGNLPPGTLTPRVAALVLMPPIVLNSLFKAAATISIAGWQHARPAALALTASAAACAAAVPLVW